MTKKYEFRLSKRDDGSYKVSLPHQCDEWIVTGDITLRKVITKEQAILDLTQFISEAQEILEELKC